jgi:hypothetical protein
MQGHLSQERRYAPPSFRGQQSPDRRRQIAHRGILANAPGRIALRTRFSAIRRNPSIYERYREWDIEDLFRRTKAIMRTRPIFHSSDAAIRGHVFCSFLALAMQKHLDDLLRQTGLVPEWKDLLRDLDRLAEVRIRHRGADWLVRADAAQAVAALFRAAHVVLPPRARKARPPPPAQPKPARKRRGRPRRSATST